MSAVPTLHKNIQKVSARETCVSSKLQSRRDFSRRRRREQEPTRSPWRKAERHNSQISKVRCYLLTKRRFSSGGKQNDIIHKFEKADVIREEEEDEENEDEASRART